MVNKKGIEMSVNALVAVVLGIVILGVGLLLFSNVFVKHTDIETTLRNQIAENLKKMATDNNRVVIYPDPVEVEDESAIFGVGIFNAYQNEETFTIGVRVVEGDISPSDVKFLEEDHTIAAKDSKEIFFVIDKNILPVGQQQSIQISVTKSDGSPYYNNQVVQVIRS